MPTVRTTEDQGLETFYLEFGPESEAESTVLLLGHPAFPPEQWDRIAGFLAAKRRVLCPEYRGGRRTTCPDGAVGSERNVELISRDILAFLNGLGVERAHVFGFGFGGLVAQNLTVLHPRRVKSLVLGSTHTGGEHQVPAHAHTTDTFAGGVHAGASGEHRHYALVEALHQMTPRRRPETVDDLMELLRDGALSESELGHWAEGERGFSVFDFFPAIEAPTLVLHGAVDPLMPPDNARILRRHIPGAERVEIENTGHLFFLEEPGTTFAALETFLERVDEHVP